MWKLRFPVGNDAGKFRIGANLAFNFGFAAHALNTGTGAQGGHFKHQSVAGNYGAAKARFLYTGEEHQLLITIFYLSQREDRTALGHGLDHQHAGHDRGAGKMSLKIFFVDAYLLDADDALTRDEFDDSIYQEKGIPVREKFLNRF